MKSKNFCMPKFVEVDDVTLSDTYGKFIVQPLERGFGTTLGNALRRVLLSSVEGTAIRAIKIEGVHHEFSTIPGVVEDVSEIILNLKEVCLKLHTDGDKTFFVEKEGAGELTAGALQVDSEIEILNPDLHIATFNEGARFRAEILVGYGHGYVMSEDNKLPDQPIDWIAMDSIFSPVRKVSYAFENMRVGERTDYDKLTMEVWTNGTIRPDDAVAFSAKLLIDHLRHFINFEEEPEDIEEEEVDHESERIKALLKMNVEELELSVRSSNCLKAAGIQLLKDLVQKTESEMLKYRNFGRKSLSELSGILGELGLSFGMDVMPYLGEKKKQEEPEEKECA
ncbi:MAG: DNA-directed RNA polymerase subunit alpha [Candidatus Latescibacterota bacterium]|nr:MAG: DNA-directed RNA polymerase subunit alpha [Candidatus Latescibacteria bacterium 4484_107]RKY70205.1 MAG: DNA-directed RNA polymerase subunit alpha [Candidatus Latescibacterota bacterium]